MMTIATLLVVIGAAVAAGIALTLHRRQRRQLEELMRRLDELETARVDATMNGPFLGDPTENGDEIDLALSRDVLAGHTSRVRRLTTGECEAATLADQAIVCVHRRLDEPVAPSELADELCVSLRTFERGMAMALGCTPRQLILAIKMREAWRLLESGRFNVTEVAYRLGFSSSSHFSHRFRTFFHKRPSEVA